MHPIPNSEPWRICYRELAPKLLLFARQWVGTMSDAEDVVQTAFVKFWRHQPSAGREHYPLLYSAVRTAALDMLRAQNRRMRREADPAVEVLREDATWLDSSVERQDDAALIERAMRGLPPEQAQVLVLRIWGELTFAEIAAALDQSINTVASRHRYAIEALRRTLRSYEPARIGV
ncbi:MAG TPA: sigma-70 family RNA polymerase sigma factor [Chthoniobacteraceae bacterium]|jgi:RNA polymerase sigma-70 factor (ECF subfamily)|nr:polymerase, sigma-24 subunit, subfamily [Chthoniobacter sp.]HEV7866810.1 sigma-70 family RNA polymerase sigma factor [Chthoniobacteraceae bacterium]